MSIDFSYRPRKDEPGAVLRELDDVAILAAAVTDDGDMIEAGTIGTIVGVYGEGEAFIVEFAHPEGALVSTGPTNLRRVGRQAR